jgi:hypothetical protein
VKDASWFWNDESSFVEIDTCEDILSLELEGPRIDELRTLLSRGLNTWERAPEWLLRLAEIVGNEA